MRFRIAVVTTITALLMIVAPAPAFASHTCGLDDVPIVGPVCDGYHSPKLVIQYLLFCATNPLACL